MKKYREVKNNIMIRTTAIKDTSLPTQKEFLHRLTDYLTEANVPKQLVSAITGETFLNENPSYYQYYPHLFKTAFKIVDVNHLNILSIAGFLYYKAVMVMDSVFDNKSSVGTFESYLLSDICKEESIKLLSSLFPINHSFWQSWNLRKMEYAKAYKIDQESHKIESYADYEQLADFKCAFGKVAIDALQLLSKDTGKLTYVDLLNSHRNYYTAFQIMDDITDFKEDFENGQFNIALFALEKRIGKEEIEKRSIGDLKNQLYLTHSIEELYERALMYLAQAKSTIEKYELSSWKHEIQTLNNTIVRHRLNVKGFIKVFNTRQELAISYQKANFDIERSLLAGFGFIEKSQEKEYCWNDYFNDAGTSDVWTTSFLLAKTFTKDAFFSEDMRPKAIEFLKTHKNEDHNWGYNSQWISDADSTTFAMLSLLRQGDEVGQETLYNWYLHQNIDGGFSTYKDSDTVITSLNSPSINNVKGWTQSHFCVSAAAYLFFCEATIDNKNFNALRNYLLACLNNKTEKLSYWWTDDIYSFALLIKGAQHKGDTEILDLLVPELETYLQKTSFAMTMDTSNYFYLGLILDCIASSEKLFKNYEKEASNIVQSLLATQYEDGSWKESYAMRIPHPSVENPDLENINWTKNDFGTNILVSDFHRLFSTSSCISGLTSYREVLQNKKELTTVST